MSTKAEIFTQDLTCGKGLCCQDTTSTIPLTPNLPVKKHHSRKSSVVTTTAYVESGNILTPMSLVLVK